MRLKIVHWSDSHGERRKLPDADLYINTGDNNQDFPERYYPRQKWLNPYYRTSREREREKQPEWVKRNPYVIPREGAPVVIVRGNHDFVSFAEQFPDNPVYEIQPDENPTQMEYELFGLRIGGFRGVGRIDGESMDELTNHDWTERWQYWSRYWDIIVTHTPPARILDKAYGGYRYGCERYAEYLNDRFYETENPPKLCCFGHVHESGGKIETIEGTIFSNAATKINIIELEV